MIHILNINSESTGILQRVIDCLLVEELNGEYTLDITIPYEEYISSLVDMNSTFSVNGQLFDVGFISYDISNNNEQTIKLECDHISYRLNRKEYDLEAWDEETETGFADIEEASADDILDAILEGTPFNGITTIPGTFNFSISGSTTRRSALYEFLSIVGGEISYDNTNITVSLHRGSTDPKFALVGKNIISLNKDIDKRTRSSDETKKFLETYGCDLLVLDETYNVGDDVKIIYKPFNIDTIQRVIRMEYNPIIGLTMLGNGQTKITLGDSPQRNLEDNIDTDISDNDLLDEFDNLIVGPPGEEGPPGPKGEKGDPGEDDNNIRTRIQNATQSEMVECTSTVINIRTSGIDYTLDLDTDVSGTLNGATQVLTVDNARKITLGFLDEINSKIIDDGTINNSSYIKCVPKTDYDGIIEDVSAGITIRTSSDADTEYYLDFSGAEDGDILQKKPDVPGTASPINQHILKFSKPTTIYANANVWIGTELPPTSEASINTLYLLYDEETDI